MNIDVAFNSRLMIIDQSGVRVTIGGCIHRPKTIEVFRDGEWKAIAMLFFNVEETTLPTDQRPPAQAESGSGSADGRSGRTSDPR